MRRIGESFAGFHPCVPTSAEVLVEIEAGPRRRRVRRVCLLQSSWVQWWPPRSARPAWSAIPTHIVRIGGFQYEADEATPLIVREAEDAEPGGLFQYHDKLDGQEIPGPVQRMRICQRCRRGNPPRRARPASGLGDGENLPAPRSQRGAGLNRLS